MAETWSDRMKQEGLREGILLGKRDDLLRVLRHKFGDLPEEAVRRVRDVPSVEDADRLMTSIVDADSLADTGLDGGN